MIQTLSRLPQSRNWWLFLLVFCVALEVAALYYQYVLDYLPCVLCIHVRILLLGIALLSIVALAVRRFRPAAISLSIAVLGLWVWMAERSYMLLGTERGWIMGECSMESGLPSWFAPDRWFPALFHIHEPCGYTPYVIGKISMAEVLMVIGVLMCCIVLAGIGFNLLGASNQPESDNF